MTITSQEAAKIRKAVLDEWCVTNQLDDIELPDEPIEEGGDDGYWVPARIWIYKENV